MNIKDFWIPSFKHHLVDVLCLKYPRDRKRFEKMSKKRLYAILFSVRRRKNGNTIPETYVG